MKKLRNKIIYLIVGKSCSGKTSSKEYFESQGFTCFEASKYMKENIAKYKLSPEELFIKFGKDFVSKIINGEIEKLDKNSNLVISGLRTPEEIIFFKNKIKTKVIGINSSDRLCFERNLERKREDVEIDYNTFINKRISFNSKIGLSDVFDDLVDYWVENESTIEELYSQLNKIMEKENGKD